MDGNGPTSSELGIKQEDIFSSPSNTPKERIGQRIINKIKKLRTSSPSKTPQAIATPNPFPISENAEIAEQFVERYEQDPPEDTIDLVKDFYDNFFKPERLVKAPHPLTGGDLDRQIALLFNPQAEDGKSNYEAKEDLTHPSEIWSLCFTTPMGRVALRSQIGRNKTPASFSKENFYELTWPKKLPRISKEDAIRAANGWHYNDATTGGRFYPRSPMTSDFRPFKPDEWQKAEEYLRTLSDAGYRTVLDALEITYTDVPHVKLPEDIIKQTLRVEQPNFKVPRGSPYNTEFVDYEDGDPPDTRYGERAYQYATYMSNDTFRRRVYTKVYDERVGINYNGRGSPYILPPLTIEQDRNGYKSTTSDWPSWYRYDPKDYNHIYVIHTIEGLTTTDPLALSRFQERFMALTEKVVELAGGATEISLVYESNEKEPGRLDPASKANIVAKRETT